MRPEVAREPAFAHAEELSGGGDERFGRRSTGSVGQTNNDDGRGRFSRQPPCGSALRASAIALENGVLVWLVTRNGGVRDRRAALDARRRSWGAQHAALARPASVRRSTLEEVSCPSSRSMPPAAVACPRRCRSSTPVAGRATRDPLPARPDRGEHRRGRLAVFVGGLGAGGGDLDRAGAVARESRDWSTGRRIRGHADDRRSARYGR